MAKIYFNPKRKEMNELGIKLHPHFMTKVACEDEITMDDIRRVLSYRDELIVVLNKRSPKPPNVSASEYTFQNTLFINEIKKVHKWLNEKLIYKNEMR